MKTFQKQKVFDFLLLTSISTLLSLFVGLSNSYSYCGGTPASCGPAKTACISAATSNKAFYDQEAHRVWDPIPCIPNSCMDLDVNGNVPPACSQNPTCLDRANSCKQQWTGNCASMLNVALTQNANNFNLSKQACDLAYDKCTAPCLTITATSGGNGSISPGTVSGIEPGWNMAFNMYPFTCYHVADVKVDGTTVGPVSYYTFFNIIEDHTIASTFAINTVTLNTSTGIGGIITPSSLATTCGTPQTFSIVSNPGYHIIDVTVDNVSKGPISSYTFTNASESNNSVHNISASFYNKYTLNMTKSGTGAGTVTSSPSGITCGSTCAAEFLQDSSVMLTGSPDSVSFFVGWSGGGCSGTGTCTVPITANKTVTAIFNPNKLAVTTNGTGVGSVTFSPIGTSCGAGCMLYSVGTAVTLHPLPNADSSFFGWSGGGCSGTGDCTVTLNSATSVAATINILPPIAAFAASSTEGNIPLLVNFTNQSQRAWDASRTSTPWADTYTWNFGDGTTSNEENPQHFYKVVGAYVATLTVKNPSGTSTASINITVNSCSNFPVRLVHPNNILSGYYTALQDAYNAAIDGDSIQALALNFIGDLNVDGPKAVTLTGGYACDYQTQVGITSLQGMVSDNNGILTLGDFAIVTGPTDNVYQIVASAGSGGSISPTGTVTFAQGANQTFAITPIPNYFILDVLVDGTSVGPISTYTFSNISTNHKIEATFSTTYTITATAGVNGAISPVGPATVVADHDQIFTITPAIGYHVTDVIVDGSSVGPATSFAFNKVTTDHTISASFAINTYTITATSGLGGSITPSGSIPVNYGASQTFTWTPAPGFLLLDVLVDGVSVGAVSSYMFNNVTAPHTITPIYSNTLTVLKTGSGFGTVTSTPTGINCGAACSAEYMQGSTVILTATPDANSLFAGWAGGGCTGIGTCTTTLTANTAITASFNLKPPVAGFNGTPTTAVQAVAVTFIDLSTLNPTSWFWEFGDGTTSTLKNPTHTYSVVGTYAVKLTSTNAGGSNTVTNTGYIVVKPYVRILGSATVYRTIQEAYDAATDGATIQVQALNLTENFNSNSVVSKTITLEGGYDAAYSIVTGVTTLKGSVATTTGIVTIKDLSLQK